jgi:hypothetical protein
MLWLAAKIQIGTLGLGLLVMLELPIQMGALIVQLVEALQYKPTGCKFNT